MNLQQINEIRATAGLKPLQANPDKQAKHKRQAANQAARAAESRALKTRRTGRACHRGGK